MIELSWVFVRSGGWQRLAIVASSAAIVTALLLVAGTMLLLPDLPEEHLFNLISDPGTRIGAILSLLLLTLPVLTLLYQGVRLGTAARERRLAGLRLAGATVRQVRMMGAIEVGGSALFGSVLGIPVFMLLQAWLGGTPYPNVGSSGSEVLLGAQVAKALLIPRSVALELWQVALLVLLVAAVGFAIGARASSGLTISPLGVARREAHAPPRPWGLLILLASALLIGAIASGRYRNSELAFVAAVALAVVGTFTLAPWLAYRIGLSAQDRAGSAAGLLAARRLVDDPRTVGRAAAATGAIGLIAGGGTTVLAEFLEPALELDAFYSGSYALAASALVAALIVACATMSIHSIETIWDRKRSMSGLVALGASQRELERSQVIEAGLVGLSSTAAGYALGASAYLPLVRPGADGIALVLGMGLGILAMVGLGIALAVHLTRPWLIRAISSENLRRE